MVDNFAQDELVEDYEAKLEEMNNFNAELQAENYQVRIVVLIHCNLVGHHLSFAAESDVRVDTIRVVR